MLNDMTLTQIVDALNAAIEQHSLPIKPVTKKTFKDKSVAVAKVQRVMDAHDLALENGVMIKRPHEELDDSTKREIADELGDRMAIADAVGKESAVENKSHSSAPESAPNTAPENAPSDSPETSTVAATETKKPARRRAYVYREPRPADQIGECREGSNQAILVDVMFVGSTIEAATRHLNNSLQKNLAREVIYSTILYDLCSIKGYGVRAEPKNGEQLAALDLAVDAEELKWDTVAKAAREGYDPEVTRAVYFLVLPEGMTTPKPHKPSPERKAAEAKEAREAKKAKKEAEKAAKAAEAAAAAAAKTAAAPEKTEQAAA